MCVCRPVTLMESIHRRQVASPRVASEQVRLLQRAYGRICRYAAAREYNETE